MLKSSDPLIERLQRVSRCQPEILKISQEMAGLTSDQYDSLAGRLTEEGLDHALGILLIVAAVNKIVLNPVILANSLKTVDIIDDIRYLYNFQSADAIAPLLTVVQSEDLSHERQAFAARLAVELAVKFAYPKQPIKKVLWRLLEEIGSPEARMFLNISLDLLEKENTGSFDFRLIGGDALSGLPAEHPPVVIGDGGTIRRPVAKLGRNEPCRCGSGRKYKKCCYDADQEKIKDASSYEGVTMSDLRDNPALVNDVSYIERLRPYELRKLIPSRMNTDQLFSAYRRADTYGLRDLAFDMLAELKARPGKEEFAAGHMVDLFDSALNARDMETVRRLIPHIPEENRYLSDGDRVKHELIENTDKFRDLEALCRKAFIDNKDHQLLELSYAFEDILPALSLVFARAAIVSEPQRSFDNEMLLDAIHKTRIELDLEPWGDPIEDYWDWIIGQNETRSDEKDKDEEIRKLQEQLSKARDESSMTLKNLREKEAALNALEKKLQKSPVVAHSQIESQPVESAAKLSSSPTDERYEEKRQEISMLRKKIESFKDQITNQQEMRRQLRQQLQAAYEKLSKRDIEKAPGRETADEEPAYPSGIPERVHIPEFTESFRRSCEDIPPSTVIKAMQAAVGFGARDKAVLRQAEGIERLPSYYRIRIGIHHRLMVRQTPKNILQILEVIHRKQMDTWIKQHS